MTTITAIKPLPIPSSSNSECDAVTPGRTHLSLTPHRRRQPLSQSPRDSQSPDLLCPSSWDPLCVPVHPEPDRWPKDRSPPASPEPVRLPVFLTASCPPARSARGETTCRTTAPSAAADPTVANCFPLRATAAGEEE